MHGNDGSLSYTTHALIRNPKAHGTPKANAMYLYATKVFNDFDKVLPGCTASRLGQLTQVVLYAAKCSAIEIITARLHKHVRLVRLIGSAYWLVGGDSDAVCQLSLCNVLYAAQSAQRA